MSRHGAPSRWLGVNSACPCVARSASPPGPVWRSVGTVVGSACVGGSRIRAATESTTEPNHGAHHRPAVGGREAGAGMGQAEAEVGISAREAEVLALVGQH